MSSNKPSFESENNETDFSEKLISQDENIWDIPTSYSSGMRVPGRLFLSKDLLRDLDAETIKQVVNVAKLPGVQKYSMAMPDVHLGYGFVIGGVAAFDPEDGGVISPGGVGFDINCGVRLMKTSLTKADVDPVLPKLVDMLFKKIPTGVGSKSQFKVNDEELTNAFLNGSKWAIEAGFGVPEDSIFCEAAGAMQGGDPSKVSIKSRRRGRPQFGTLGSGNHFVEIQYIDKIYDEKAAEAYGIYEGQVCTMIHCGSRGAGHQICTDYLQVMNKAVKKYKISIDDMQLACAPANSEEAQDYYKSMICGANYAWANRQVIMHWTREVLMDAFKRDFDSLGLDLLYDVAHNVAKLEKHEIDGSKKEVYVHRKGATRAFPAGHFEIPFKYRDIGQPVLIPGSMGTPSYILIGGPKSMELSFGSACHGAGRVLGRGKAIKTLDGKSIKEGLADKGIIVKAERDQIIAEEAPEVYKPSNEVVDVVDKTGIALKVARLIPMGVIKG